MYFFFLKKAIDKYLLRDKTLETEMSSTTFPHWVLGLYSMNKEVPQRVPLPNLYHNPSNYSLCAVNIFFHLFRPFLFNWKHSMGRQMSAMEVWVRQKELELFWMSCSFLAPCNFEPHQPCWVLLEEEITHSYLLYLTE